MRLTTSPNFLAAAFVVAAAILFAAMGSFQISEVRGTMERDLVASVERDSGGASQLVSREIVGILERIGGGAITFVDRESTDILLQGQVRAELDATLRAVAAQAGLMKLSLFSLDGYTVYSTGSERVGARMDATMFDRVRSGRITGQVVSGRPGTARGGDQPETHIASTYVPLRWDSFNRPTAILGIDTDVGGDVARMRAAQRARTVTVATNFGILYLLLLAMVLTVLRALSGALNARDRHAEALARSESLFRVAINSLDQGLMVFGPDHRIATWNHAFARMSPAVAGRIRTGMRFEEMVRITADVAVEAGIEAQREEYFARRMARHARPGEPFEIEMIGRRRVELCERPTENGGFLITYRDVTAERQAQESSAVSELLASDAIDSMEDALVIFDSEACLVHWNGRFETMFAYLGGKLRRGMSQREVLELHVASGLYAIPETDRAAWVDRRLDTMITPGLGPVQHLADGRVLRGRVRARQGGGHIIILQDITTEAADAAALADAKARAEASEARIRDFAEAASDWFWEAAPDGKLTFLSGGITRFGLDPEQLISRDRSQLPYSIPKGQPGIALIAAATAAHTAFKDVEYEGILRDGRTVTIAISGTPLFASDGSYLGHRGSGRDVTEARQRERELQRQSQLLQTIFTSMGEGISVFDHDMKLVAWNDRFVDLTGATVPGLGVTLRDILLSQAKAGEFGTCEPEAEVDRRIREQFGRQAVVRERQRPDGRTIELRRNPIVGGGIVTIYVDITQRKAQEQQLAEAMERERELGAQQRRFVAIAAHEFRTPLTIIDGAAQRLLRNAERMQPDDLRARADKIRSAVARMSLLIDTTLNSARLDAGSIEASFSNLDIVALVSAIIKRQEGVSHDFTFAMTSNAPRFDIDADPRLLDQVFTNLIANAVKYSGASRRVELTLDCTTHGVITTVRDFGLGVPADELPKLFTRFFRASTAKGLPGTGIGLNLVKELVALHGGTVTVESRVAAGSSFTVTLPVIAERARGTEPAPAAA